MRSLTKVPSGVTHEIAVTGQVTDHPVGRHSTHAEVNRDPFLGRSLVMRRKPAALDPLEKIALNLAIARKNQRHLEHINSTCNS